LQHFAAHCGAIEEASKMHQTMIRGVRLALAITASLCLLAAPALADDRPWEQERWNTVYAGSVSSEEDLFADQRWVEIRPRTDDQHEFEYSRGLSLKLEENVLFSIQSPLAGEWAPGLAFELRF
jgi:hypothetical protein